MSMNHLMPLETSPSEMAYQIHFRFKQHGDSFWKEGLGGVFWDNEKLSHIMKNDTFITFHTHYLLCKVFWHEKSGH